MKGQSGFKGWSEFVTSQMEYGEKVAALRGSKVAMQNPGKMREE